MPQRFLRPGITTSELWNGVSFQAQSLFIRLLTLVDDYGRYDGRTSVIWSQCFAVWNEKNQQEIITPQQVDKMLQQLAAATLIEIYEADSKKVLQISQWKERIRDNVVEKWPKKPTIQGDSKKLQQLNATSCGILPSSSSSSSVPSSSSGDPQNPAESASPPSETVPEELPLSGKPPEPKPERKRFEKPSIEAVKLQAAKIGLPESEAIKFWNYYESKGWKVGKSPMVSWHSALVNWRSNWQERGGQLPSEQQPTASKAQRNADLLSQVT